jgi:hypothetical protein
MRRLLLTFAVLASASTHAAPKVAIVVNARQDMRPAITEKLQALGYAEVRDGTQEFDILQKGPLGIVHVTDVPPPSGWPQPLEADWLEATSVCDSRAGRPPYHTAAARNEGMICNMSAGMALWQRWLAFEKAALVVEISWRNDWAALHTYAPTEPTQRSQEGVAHTGEQAAELVERLLAGGGTVSARPVVRKFPPHGTTPVTAPDDPPLPRPASCNGVLPPLTLEPHGIVADRLSRLWQASSQPSGTPMVCELQHRIFDAPIGMLTTNTLQGEAHLKCGTLVIDVDTIHPSEQLLITDQVEKLLCKRLVEKLFAAQCRP